MYVDGQTTPLQDASGRWEFDIWSDIGTTGVSDTLAGLVTKYAVALLAHPVATPLAAGGPLEGRRDDATHTPPSPNRRRRLLWFWPLPFDSNAGENLHEFPFITSLRSAP
jgi:hypothetical protein